MRAADDLTQTRPGWLSPDELSNLRGLVPMVYVDAIPVRLDRRGEVVEVGLLLRAMPDGTVSRAVVSGRVLYGETVRDALLRHLAKDLGTEAEPRLSPSPSPFTVVEYFPDPEITGYHDPRQHAVSLAYVVPVDGFCRPPQNTLEFTWLTPAEADSPAVRREMTGGHDRLVRLALAHANCLP
jgi:ADP-ribose pyrophosphatase YjhB (NUDIX family)